MEYVTNNKSKGFTLIEAMMAVVILAIAAGGFLLPFTSGAAVRLEANNRTQGAILCAELIERIVNTPFDNIVGTYGSYSESQGQIKDTSGVVLTGRNYIGFSRDASCEYVYVAQEDGTGQTKYILITARAYYNGDKIATVNRLVTK